MRAREWMLASSLVGVVSCSSCGERPGLEAGEARDVEARDSASEASLDSRGGQDDSPDTYAEDVALDVISDGAWTASPHFTTCPWWIGDTAKVAIGGRTWSSCGAGCRETRAARDGLTVADHLSVAAEGRPSDFLVRLTSSKGPGTDIFTEFTELNADRLTAIVRRKSSGGLCMIGGRSPRILAGAEITKTTKLVFARLGDSGSFEWQDSVIDLPGDGNAMALWGGGTAFFLYDGSVRTLKSPTQKALEMAWKDPVGAWQPSSGTKQVIWRTVESKARLLRVSDAGATILQTEDGWITGVGQSDRWIVWGHAGGGSSSGTWSSVDVRWSPWTGDAAGISVTVGPKLAATNTLHSFAVGGDYAASLGCVDSTPESCAIFVVNLVSKKLWQIPFRTADVRWRDVYALSDTEMLLGESPAKTDPGVVEKLVILQLDKLDLFGK